MDLESGTQWENNDHRRPSHPSWSSQKKFLQNNVKKMFSNVDINGSKM
jgi:hypothetical protein